MNKNFLLNYVAVAIMLASTMAQTNASIVIVDTASGTPGPVGATVSDDFFLFHRFEILSTTTLSSVGGHFRNTSAGSADVFAAIVALSGSADLPDSLDLSTPDVLATGLITLPQTNPGNLFQTQLNPTLQPGWYALGFGTGQFGATSGVNGVALEQLATDLDPSQRALRAIQTTPTTTGSFGDATRRLRFTVTAVPEPSTAVLLVLFLGVASTGRHRRSLKTK